MCWECTVYEVSTGGSVDPKSWALNSNVDTRTELNVVELVPQSNCYLLASYPDILLLLYLRSLDPIKIRFNFENRINFIRSHRYTTAWSCRVLLK